MSLALAAAFAGAGGCSSGGGTDDCETFCAKTKQQGCESGPTDCASQCKATLGTMDDAGCTVQYDAVISCALAQSDVCTAQDACVSQLMAWGNCINPYCKQHATDPTCVNIE
jgi:hypothetical protein